MRLTLLIITPASIGDLLPNGVWIIFVLLYHLLLFYSPSVLLFFLRYVLFVFHHHKTRYEMWMFNLWMFFSAVLSLSSIVTFLVYVVQHTEFMDPKVLKHVGISASFFERNSNKRERNIDRKKTTVFDKP